MQSLPHSTTPYNVKLQYTRQNIDCLEPDSLAWHLALTKSFAWLVGRVNKPTTRQTSHANDLVNAKSHLDGRFRLYDFCLRLSCASSIRKDFRPSPRAQSSPATSAMCRTNVVGLTFTRHDLS